MRKFYPEALKGIVNSPNQKLLMLPFETQQIASSIAGIAELTKSVLGDNNTKITKK